MAKATPEQAVAHPNWSHGRQDFGRFRDDDEQGPRDDRGRPTCSMTPQERIDVLIHPQSVIHSLVEYADGSTLAQLGPPDMRSPISCAFSWPQRLSWPAKRLDLAAYAQLTFEAPDLDRFPAIAIAREALRLGAARRPP